MYVCLSVGERERVRTLYERLLERTSHVKVWLSFAQYEASEAKASIDSAAGDAGTGAGTGTGDDHDLLLCVVDVLTLILCNAK